MGDNDTLLTKPQHTSQVNTLAWSIERETATVIGLKKHSLKMTLFALKLFQHRKKHKEHNSVTEPRGQNHSDNVIMW